MSETEISPKAECIRMYPKAEFDRMPNGPKFRSVD